LALALDSMSSGDWLAFESFAAAFLAPEFPSLRTPASPHGDRGRDGQMYVVSEDPNTVVQYSVAQDWNAKIRATVNRLKETMPATRTLIYATNQVIGPDADKLVGELRRNNGVSLDIRDRNWFVERESRFNWVHPWPSNLAQHFLFIWFWGIPAVGVLGAIVMLLYTSQVPSEVRWSTFGTAVVIAASAYFTGGIVGFLFGIPRTVQGSARSERVTQYQGNTNLEQVSDWLTKIIVGVGLVQIGHIVPALSKLAESMKAPLGGLPSSGAFGLGLVINYAAIGFLFFYLWSRSLFARELEEYNTPQQQNNINKSAQSTDSSSEPPT